MKGRRGRKLQERARVTVAAATTTTTMILLRYAGLLMQRLPSACVRACVFVHCAITIIIIISPQHRQRNMEVARVSAVAAAAAAAAA